LIENNKRGKKHRINSGYETSIQNESDMIIHNLLDPDFECESVLKINNKNNNYFNNKLFSKQNKKRKGKK
jgi:hypothetical protein